MKDISAWIKALSRLQSLLNNTNSATTRLSPNEIAYEFEPNAALDLLSASLHVGHSMEIEKPGRHILSYVPTQT